MSEEVFLDSGIFIAFLIRSDRFHGEAVSLFSRPPRRWSTSVLVVAETYGWFLHKLGEGSARSFRLLLQAMPELVVLGADARHQQAVWSKLDELRGPGLTYVDASSLAWMAERKIRLVWGTDHHLALEGATVAPGPFA